MLILLKSQRSFVDDKEDFYYSEKKLVLVLDGHDEYKLININRQRISKEKKNREMTLSC